ncbi:DNA gyrase subunit A [Candidatus Microgenomates bacterium]|nr:DNA gyrase subunit A [Candidatus Microgenomates bacterium]
MDIGKIQQVEITEEIQKSYLDYAMSVIVARALPDVRDGLKPVHRRILYAMHQMGLGPTSKFLKSARIVGETMGKYHPHGNMPIYDALVRLAQDFSMRYPLVWGQGNFGSVDGDPPAADRYTEAKLRPISLEMLGDIEKETVRFIPNYDGSFQEPEYLPAKLPNLLLMGAEGIAVGMATKIPPHNLREVAAAILATVKKGKLIKVTAEGVIDGKTTDSVEFTIRQIKLEAGQFTASEPQNGEITPPKMDFASDITIEELNQIVPGPDFPTGGAIYDAKSLLEVYATGRGKIIVRGVAKIEDSDRGKSRIVISELPYQVNKAQLVMRIAAMVHEKRLVGISDIRDESDRRGMSVVIEIKKDGNAKSILNNLFKHTALQSSFPANFVALVDGVPRTLNLKQILVEYVAHRQEIIIGRTIFDLRAAQRRAHILEGLKIALDNLDEVIKTIRQAESAESAKSDLMRKFKLTEIQATAILDMQLRRLAKLEREKIEAEYKEIMARISELEAILRNSQKVLEIIEAETKDLVQKFGDERKTKIYQTKIGEFSQEDLVAKVETLITLTSGGYIKRVPLATYRQQARGGKGVLGMTAKREDEIVHLTSASTHDTLLVFTDRGRVYATPVWEIPEGTRLARGQAIVNLIGLEGSESVQAILPLTKDQGYKFLFMATEKGIVKKTSLAQFANIRGRGIVAIKLEKGRRPGGASGPEGDSLVWVKPTGGEDEILLVTKKGKAIKFKEAGIRPTGRATQGVRGVKLGIDDSVIGMEVVETHSASSGQERVDGRRKPFTDILVVTERGIGKRTPVRLFPTQGRGGQGVKIANITPRTGNIISALFVTEDVEQIVLTSRGNQVIKLPIRNVPELSRAAQGVILMRFANKEDSVAAVATLDKDSTEVEVSIP